MIGQSASPRWHLHRADFVFDQGRNTTFAPVARASTGNMIKATSSTKGPERL